MENEIVWATSKLLNISKEVKVLNIHVHVHVMKIHEHWYMFRKGIEMAAHLHFHSDDGLFYKSQVTKKNKVMNKTYPSTPGADFYGVGGLVEGVEVIPEYCVGSFTFPGYQ